MDKDTSPVEIRDISNSEDLFCLHILCKQCETPLAKSREMTGREMAKDWGMLVMGSGLSVGACPKGCKSTYRDLNINTAIVIYPAKCSR